MQKVLLAVACLSLAASLARAEQELILRLDFDSPEQMAALGGAGGRVESGYEGTACLLIERTERTGGIYRSLALPAEKLAGRAVTLSAVVRAEDISERPQPWNGVKVMVVLESEDSKDYPHIPFDIGTFGWVQVQRTFRARRMCGGHSSSSVSRR